MIIRTADIPVVVFKEDESYIPRRAHGKREFVLPSEMEPIIQGLIEYCHSYSDEDIKKANELCEICDTDIYEDPLRKREKRGYVYLFKCANKYKIGYSKNVERRLKELDTRPFKLEFIWKVYSDKAYDIEQELHKRLEAYREIGEWYTGVDEQVIKNMLIEIGGWRIFRCEAQF